MPPNYATALTPQQLDAFVNYVYHSTNTKFKGTKTPVAPHAAATLHRGVLKNEVGEPTLSPELGELAVRLSLAVARASETNARTGAVERSVSRTKSRWVH